MLDCLNKCAVTMSERIAVDRNHIVNPIESSIGRVELRRSLFLTSIVFVLALFVSCQAPGPVALPPQARTPVRVTLAPGDVIKLTFSGAPEMNQTQKVQADGRVSLPLIGEVTAARKTVSQLQSELVALYEPQLKNSDVVVSLESAVASVYISGAVNKPGKIGFDRPTTVLQALMEAGGPNQFGNLGRVHLIRLANGVQQTLVLDLRSTLNGQATPASYVRDGDIISVPESAF
jgi:polysaccharide export outer membrane protein